MEQKIELQSRIRNLRRILDKNKLDCALIFGLSQKDENIKYFCGFPVPLKNYVIISKDRIYIIENYFLKEYISRLKKLGEIVVFKHSYIKTVKNILIQNKFKKIGLVGELIPYNEMKELKEFCFIDINPQVEQLRAIKSAIEINLIKESYKKLSNAIINTLQIVKPGCTEKEIAAMIEYECLKQGADYMTFPTTVFSGKRLDGRPVDLPTNRKIRKGEIILLDAGASFSGYCSDITRCIFIGKNRYQLVYEKLVNAQEYVINSIHPYISAKQIFNNCKLELSKRKLLKYFKHTKSIGHGIGARFHEMPYRISADTDFNLQKGSVFTVEPTLSKKDCFTLRVEDAVAIMKKGVKEISFLPKAIYIKKL